MDRFLLEPMPTTNSVPIAETSEVVLVPAKLLALGLRLVLAKCLVDDRPDDIVVLHLDLKSFIKLDKEANCKRIITETFHSSDYTVYGLNRQVPMNFYVSLV